MRIRRFFLASFGIVLGSFFFILGFTGIATGIYIFKKIRVANLSSHHQTNTIQLDLLSQNVDLLEKILQKIAQESLILQQFSEEGNKKNRFGIGGPDVSLLKQISTQKKVEYEQRNFKENIYFKENGEILPINISHFENTDHIKRNLTILKKISKEEMFLGENPKLLTFLNKKKEIFQIIPSQWPLSRKNKQYTYEILKKSDQKKGVFIRVPTTTQVLATSSGVVENIQIDPLTGKFSVIIIHRMGLKSEYRNLSSCAVSPEKLVYVNQILGTTDSEFLYRIKLGGTYEPAKKYLPANL